MIHLILYSMYCDFGKYIACHFKWDIRQIKNFVVSHAFCMYVCIWVVQRISLLSSYWFVLGVYKTSKKVSWRHFIAVESLILGVLSHILNAPASLRRTKSEVVGGSKKMLPRLIVVFRLESMFISYCIYNNCSDPFFCNCNFNDIH